MFNKFIAVFVAGGTIDEARGVLRISRNLAIKKLKEHLGTNESKIKMSESRKKFFERGGISWMKGKTHTQEARAKLSDKTLEMWTSGKFKNLSFIFRSKLESNVFDYLSSMFDCVHTFRIDTKLYDIYIKSLNLVIEVNGDYWHLNPALYDSTFYDKSRNVCAVDIWNKDKLKEVKAIKNGYNFITIWQRDLKRDFVGTINEQISKYSGGDRH